MRSNTIVFHLEKLKDLACAQKYALTVSNWLEVFITLEDPVGLRDTFKRETESREGVHMRAPEI